jgi:hypothetical protein
VLRRRAICHNSIFVEFAVDPLDAAIKAVFPYSWNGHGPFPASSLVVQGIDDGFV